MSKEVLIPIANGSEDIETVTLIDVLRRAQANVTVASIGEELLVVAARGTKIIADVKISDCKMKEWDLIALPGGMPGAKNLSENSVLVELLKSQNEKGKLYAAICASPAIVLQPHGLLIEKNACCYPAFRENIPPEQLAPAHNRVVVDQNCITSLGPATAIEFALKLVELLFGKDLSDTIGKAMLC
ncbi:Dihydroxyacetone kinase [Oopsacas minuta]|uniref:Dihydroxyacetone kinase n=1 Tax=Oopsacas minuta TaxID=111878 RepID=A0AAV7JYV7_9METZ|nr:Dihydroxyacetone kinase [Oopsacas minuta]